METRIESKRLMTAREPAFGTFPSVDPISKIFQACSIAASVTNRFPTIRAELLVAIVLTTQSLALSRSEKLYTDK